MPRNLTLPDTYDAWRTAGPPDEDDFPDVTDDREPDDYEADYLDDDPADDFRYG